MQKTLIWSLGQEDPLENGMATHSSSHFISNEIQYPYNYKYFFF